MTTVIRLKPEELTEAFFKKLKSWVKQTNRVEIVISSVQEAANNLTDEEILSRHTEINAGGGRTFTMKEFEAYIRSDITRK